MTMGPERVPGKGWLALLGGGELTFGETEGADRAWLSHVPEGARIGFVPAASGSTEYGSHLAAYLRETFGRETETIPIYRARDARRGKNCERFAACGAVYLGGGVADHLLDALAGTPAVEALLAKLRQGGAIVAIAAAAEALGRVASSFLAGEPIAGLGWLPGGAVVPNFDPRDARRPRQLLEHPAVRWVLGIPAGSAVLLGPDDEIEVAGEAFVADDPEGELRELRS